MELNKFLKLAAIAVALIFVWVFITTPKTDCQVCEFSYEGKIIDGYEAFELFEDACITYNKPWDNELEAPVLNLTSTNETFISK